LPSGAHIVLSGIQLVLAGIGVGLLVAAPIGPVNVLCIQRAVTNGFWGGLAAGIGAMLGDGLLAAIAAFSVTAISDVLIAYSGLIQLVGGVLLIIFGIGLLFAPPMLLIAPGQKSHLWDHWGIIPQTFFLTISNPGAILGMLALIGGLGSLIGGLDTYLEALLLVVSVMGGSGGPNAAAEIAQLTGRAPILSTTFTAREVEDGSCAARLQAFGTAVANSKDSREAARPNAICVG